MVEGRSGRAGDIEEKIHAHREICSVDESGSVLLNQIGERDPLRRTSPSVPTTMFLPAFTQASMWAL